MQEFIVSTFADENDGDFSEGDLSLREAIAIAESGDTITFDSNLGGGTISLSLGELLIDKSITVEGLGADRLTINADPFSFSVDNPPHRIFNVDDGDDNFRTNVSINGLTIANGVVGADRNSSGDIGAGILNRENLTVNNSVITGNAIQVGGGGGIANEGELTLNESLVSDNRIGFRGAAGAGILNLRGTLNVVNSTIANNLGFGEGGGITNVRGTLNVTNSTISGNGSAFGGSGIDSTGSATITSSIIADNSNNSNLEGTFTSGGNNLIDNIDNRGGTRPDFADIDSDIIGTRDNPIDARLSELQNNGGATPTFALLINSPAIDAGSNPNNLATEQRGDGFDRTVGNGTDIGAFELQTFDNINGGVIVPDELVVSTLEDENDGDLSEGDLSLREAIAFAKSGETITFNSNLSGGTIALSLGELAIDKSLRIDGLGADSLSISGNNFSRVFLVDDNDADNEISVSIDGLTIRDGEQNGDGSGTSLGIEGGGILNQENLTVTNTLLTDNFAGNGGAIYNRGRLRLANSLVTKSDGSSPVANDGGITTISNSTFADNDATGTGAIANFNGATLDLSNSTLANNSGFDFVLSNSDDSTATVTSTIIANNQASLFPEFSDVGGTFISGGNNLIGNNNGSVGFDDPTDLVGTTDNRLDARLGQLQDNGGTTPTLALLEDSPAIDAGRNPNTLDFDQRGEGFNRIIGRQIDIGAFELRAAGNGIGSINLDRLVVSTLEDENDGDFSEGDLSLREAIAIANSNGTISFDSSLSGGTITLTLGELAIDKSLSIFGLGANNLTIDGNNASRIFNVDDASDDGFTDNVFINRLTLVNGNSAGNGGAILNRESLFMTNIAFIGNSAGNGGAIYSTGRINLENSLIAESDGTGPLFNDGGSANITNSTFANNIVAGIGAIVNTNGGRLDLSNSTLANNSGYDFVLSNSEDSTARVRSTIIANNEGSLFPEFSDAGGTFISLGNNLIGNNNGAVGFDDPTDLVGTSDNRLDARLGELQDNGGATQTLALFEDSPAIDAGSNFDPTDPASFSPILSSDQRDIGFRRTVGAGTDIGAFELQTVIDEASVIPNELVVSTLEDENDGDFREGDLSLREAIALSQFRDTINFDSSLSGGTINLTLGELAIDKRLTINGLGAEQLTIDGGGNNRVFNVSNGTDFTIDVVINGLKITGGNAKSEELGNFGGGIFNQENLELNDTQIVGNDAVAGGGIYNLDAFASINNSTIAENSIPGNNSVESRGAGIANLRSRVRVNSSAIENNVGTGIDLQESEITIVGSSVANNNDIGTGGIRSIDSTVNLENSQVNNNSASALGNSGGIFSDGDSVLNINNSTVSENSGDGPGSDPRARQTDSAGILASGTTNIIDSTISNNRGIGFGIVNSGRLNVFNSTFSGNEGTAIVNNNLNDSSTAIANSTIVNNTPSTVNGFAAGGIVNSDTGNVSLSSTIVANNGEAGTPDIVDLGELSGSNNLIGNGDGIVLSDPDLIGTAESPIDPLLGELQDNGGATETIALLGNSPAIDAGNNLNNLAADQRGFGFERTIGAGTDIGAFELQTIDNENDGDSEPPNNEDDGDSEPPNNGDDGDSEPPNNGDDGDSEPPNNENDGDSNEIVGTSGGDVLDGTESGDRIEGLDGNDTIRGLDGDDTIEGNNGNDSIEGGAGNDRLDGGAGFDSLFGGHGNDTLDAGIGNDSLDGGAGNDLLFGLGDRDTLLGGDGADTLEGGAGVDSLDGGNGNDQLFGGLDDDSLFGSAGNDLINGGSGNDSLRGDDGDDIFVLASGNGTDTIADFNRGNNLLRLSSGINFTDLTFSGNNIILGDETLAILNGFDATSLTHSNFITDMVELEMPQENEGEGNGSSQPIDNEVGGSQPTDNEENGNSQPPNPPLDGDDVINGTNADDVLLGGEGNNILFGFEGNDRLETGSGNDTLDANTGDDTLIGGNGNNILFGFDGNDVLETGSGNDTLDAGNGDDTIGAGGGNDIITAGSGNDLINAGAGSDTIDGGSDADAIDAGNGDDLINGNIGNDTLTGAAGNDTLVGGAGDDFVTGNDGSDLFVLDAQGGTNTIQDFDPSLDSIGLTDDITFGDLSITGSSDAAIAFEGETIGIITNISASDLTADNFVAYEI